MDTENHYVIKNVIFNRFNICIFNMLKVTRFLTGLTYVFFNMLNVTRFLTGVIHVFFKYVKGTFLSLLQL